MIDLSVLVLSVHTRYRTFALRIQDQLWSQYENLAPPDKASVEVLVLTDAFGLTIGAKRNALVGIARGRYVQFVDDDDQVDPDMMRSVLRATATNCDVISFHVSVTLDGGPAKLCRYDPTFGHDYNTPDEYRRIPNHICAVKRVLARETGWSDVNYGEDADYGKRLLPLLNSHHEIPKVLYHYEYDRGTSESQR